MSTMVEESSGVISVVDQEPGVADQPPLAYPLSPAASYTVQQAAELTGLSEHTLRYYERAGLIQSIRRHDSSGHRRYSAADIAKLDIMACLRAVGMPLEQMRQYIALRDQGTEAAPQHQALLRAHQHVLEERLQHTQRHLHYVQYKIAYWQAVEAHDDQAAASAQAQSRRALIDTDPAPHRAYDSDIKE